MSVTRNDMLIGRHYYIFFKTFPIPNILNNCNYLYNVITITGLASKCLYIYQRGNINRISYLYSGYKQTICIKTRLTLQMPFPWLLERPGYQ